MIALMNVPRNAIDRFASSVAFGVRAANIAATSSGATVAKNVVKETMAVSVNEVRVKIP
jgi:hypothetical protein